MKRTIDTHQTEQNAPSDVIRNAINHAVPIMAEELAKGGRFMQGS